MCALVSSQRQRGFNQSADAWRSAIAPSSVPVDSAGPAEPDSVHPASRLQAPDAIASDRTTITRGKGLRTSRLSTGIGGSSTGRAQGSCSGPPVAPKLQTNGTKRSRQSSREDSSHPAACSKEARPATSDGAATPQTVARAKDATGDFYRLTEVR